MRGGRAMWREAAIRAGLDDDAFFRGLEITKRRIFQVFAAFYVFKVAQAFGVNWFGCSIRILGGPGCRSFVILEKWRRRQRVVASYSEASNTLTLTRPVPENEEAIAEICKSLCKLAPGCLEL